MAVLVLLAMLFLPIAVGQQAEMPLTNDAIARMAEAGIPESTIVLSIRTAVREGNVKFDASPDALIALRRAGATSNVLNAILRAAAQARAERPPAQIEAGELAGLPLARGVYYRDSGGWVNLASATAWPRNRYGWWFGLGDYDVRLHVPGPGQTPRISNPRPIFYSVGLHPPGGNRFLIARIEEKDSAKIKAEEKDWLRLRLEKKAIPTESEILTRRIVAIRPAQELPPGRYAVVSAYIPGQQWILNASQFYIAP